MAKFYTNYDCIGNYLYIKGYDDGEYFSEKIELNPILYVEDLSGQSNIKNINGQALNAVNLKNRNEAYNFLKQYSGTNMLVCGNTNYGNQHIIENPELIEYKQSDIKVLFHDIEVYSDCIDGKFPEPADAACPIVSVSMYDMKKDQYYLLGFPHKKGEQKWTREDSVLHTELENADEVLTKVKYFECDDELDLINKFLLTLQKLKPDVISGWNSDSFDMAYIYNRLEKLGLKSNRLSPWGKTNIREFRNKYGNVSQSVTISGISNTDYLELYSKRNAIQSSYKLDYIAKKELNQNKIAYKGSLNELYENNYQKFIDYNLVDCVLLARIEEKRHLFDTLFSEAYRTKSNYDDSLKTVKKWENLIADVLWKKNLIPPARRPEKYTGPKIEGGFVKEPNPGRYGWAMSFDYDSLYPNLIMQYNISPEKLVESHGKKYTSVDMLLNEETDTSFLNPDETLSAAGWVYNTEKEGILPQIMRELYEERVVMKKNMIKAKQRVEAGDESAKADAIYYDTQQTTAKLLLNSGYGALATNSFLYFDNRLAESITISGQLSIRWAEKYVNEYFNKICKTEKIDYCLAIDTDSLYMDIDTLAKKFCSEMTLEKTVDFMDKFADQKIKKQLEICLEKLKDYLQAAQQKMVAKRENIASGAIWTAKKRYCMLVHDSEKVRYEVPYLKITGLDAVRSSTPDFIRPHMEKTMRLILTNKTDFSPAQKYVQNFKDIYYDSPLTAIGMPKSMNNMNNYFDLNEPTWSKKGCPAQTHGAIVYNQMIEKLNLVQYDAIQEGSKAYYIYMKKPNRCNNTHILSFNDEIPEEFGVDDRVDKDLMFKKAFMTPMEPLFKASGWEIEKKASLDSLFE